MVVVVAEKRDKKGRLEILLQLCFSYPLFLEEFTFRDKHYLINFNR